MKYEGVPRWGGGRRACLRSDPGSELRLGRKKEKEKKVAKITEGRKNNYIINLNNQLL